MKSAKLTVLAKYYCDGAPVPQLVEGMLSVHHELVHVALLMPLGRLETRGQLHNS